MIDARGEIEINFMNSIEILYKDIKFGVWYSKGMIEFDVFFKFLY